MSNKTDREIIEAELNYTEAEAARAFEWLRAHSLDEDKKHSPRYAAIMLVEVAKLKERDRYVQSEPWAPGDGTEVKCETAGNIVNDLTIDCGIHRCGHIDNGVAFRFGQRGNWILDYEHLKAAYDLATRIRAFISLSPTKGDSK
jgi:hypothetical protein